MSHPEAATSSGDSDVNVPVHDRSKVAIVLLSSLVLLVSWKFCGTAHFYESYLSHQVTYGRPQAVAAFYHFGCCFVLLGLVPVIIVKRLFREDLASYGVTLGHRLFTFRSFLIAFPLLVAGGYFAAQSPEIQDAFPLNDQAGKATPFWLHVCTYVLFYLGWEFHFRGYLQHGLAKGLGLKSAVAIQVVASAVLHLGCPVMEVLASIAAGVYWGHLAIRTKSLLSGLLQHITIGLAIDIALVYFSG